MSSPNNSRNKVALLKQVLEAGGYLVIAIAALLAANWIYNNPETPGYVMGVGGLEIVMVGVALIAGYVALRKSPIKG